MKLVQLHHLQCDTERGHRILHSAVQEQIEGGTHSKASLGALLGGPRSSTSSSSARSRTSRDEDAMGGQKRCYLLIFHVASMWDTVDRYRQPSFSSISSPAHEMQIIVWKSNKQSMAQQHRGFRVLVDETVTACPYASA